MTRARQWATSAMVSLGAAGASMLGACDIEGVTPNCSDAGECFTPPGSVNPGSTAGGTGGTGGSNSGGTGGSTGGNGGNAGIGGAGTTGGNGGSAGMSGSGGNAGSGAGGAGGSNDGGPNDAAGTDATLDRRAETGNLLDTGLLDTGFFLDRRSDTLDGADGTVP